MAGRGEGKTRSAAEFVRAEEQAGRAELIALVGKTPADVRDVMIEGESGLLNVYPPDQMPTYKPSLRRVDFKSGAVAYTYSSENPEQLRGPQHDLAWVDELAKFKTREAWDNLQMGLRLGNPRQVVTTTPRPTSPILELAARAKEEGSNVVVSTGTSYDNRANLAEAFFTDVIKPYENTRLGRQELLGELLEDVPGSLWKRDDIKYSPAPSDEEIRRIVVAVDPSASETEQAAECGIVAALLAKNGKAWVIDDKSLRGSPAKWAKTAVDLYNRLGAHRIVAEQNQGGAMVEHTLRTADPTAAVKLIHASRGKTARAEPVSALYEQGKVFHIRPFVDLEDQMCTWTHESGESPDRLDALVYALTELAVDPGFRMHPIT